MSEIEAVKCKLHENIQRIEYLNLVKDKYDEVSIKNLKDQNIMLKTWFNKLKEKVK